MLNDLSYLRDKEWPQQVTDEKVLSFLNDANLVTDSYFNNITDLSDILYKEITSKVALDDESAHLQYKDFFYYKKISKTEKYWRHYRKHISSNTEELIIDINEIAKTLDFCAIDSIIPSPDNKLIAYCIDSSGGEKFDLVILDASTKKIVDCQVKEIFGSIEWNANSDGIFYIPTGTNWKSQKIYYHKLGDQQISDKLIYEELDEMYWVDFYKNLKGDYLFISTGTKEKNEVMYIDLNELDLHLKHLTYRKDGNISHFSSDDEYFYVLINDNGRNNRLICTSISQPFVEIKELKEHSKSIQISSFDIYEQFSVLETLEDGLTCIYIHNKQNFTSFNKIDLHAGQAFAANYIPSFFEADFIYYRFSSLAQPSQIYKYTVSNNYAQLLKMQQMPSDFDSAAYSLDRVYAQSDDGEKIPISLIYKKDNFKADSSNPLYLYGYGSYGISMEPSFRPSVFSLCDRGFVFAIAHIRGGGDLGRYWYEAAKFLTKKKTFEDFIACSKHLINTKYTSAGNIVICGGSAGGMLIGACINQEPTLYKAAILYVPFVDVLETMLDSSLPLTASEFDEWGNPSEPEFYEYIKSYSPCDNVKQQNYPAIFMTAGINDPRVGYWEPAKFYSKIREMRTNKNTLLLKTIMQAGHFGGSSRFEQYKEKADEYAFILKEFNLI